MTSLSRTSRRTGRRGREEPLCLFLASCKCLTVQTRALAHAVFRHRAKRESWQLAAVATARGAAHAPHTAQKGDCHLTLLRERGRSGVAVTQGNKAMAAPTLARSIVRPRARPASPSGAQPPHTPAHMGGEGAPHHAWRARRSVEAKSRQLSLALTLGKGRATGSPPHRTARSMSERGADEAPPSGHAACCGSAARASARLPPAAAPRCQPRSCRSHQPPAASVVRTRRGHRTPLHAPCCSLAALAKNVGNGGGPGWCGLGSAAAVRRRRRRSDAHALGEHAAEHL